MLGVLTLVATLNYLDRSLLSLLMEPIKNDLNISDGQLGLLSGIAFSFFYAVAGVPLARWSDVGNRKIIISVTTLVWGGMLVLSGFVINFLQLLLVRVGVAVGEAGCVPPAQSLISDFFKRSDRPKAMAIYWMAYPLSIIVGFWGGGWIAEQVGWRNTFLLLGVPGVLIALLVHFTLREPRLDEIAVTNTNIPSLREIIATLYQQKSFRVICMAFCIGYFFGMGIIQWVPAFFMRTHGMGLVEVGVWLAFSLGVCGLLGAYLGGVISNRYMAEKESRQMIFVALVMFLSGCCYLVIYITTNKMVALIVMCLIGVLSNMVNGPIFSAIQSLVHERMRSVAVAFVFLLANLIGLGLGPLVVGLLSDILNHSYANESLRYALMIFSPGYFFIACYYYKVSKSIEADISEVEAMA